MKIVPFSKPEKPDETAEAKINVKRLLNMIIEADPVSVCVICRTETGGSTNWTGYSPEEVSFDLQLAARFVIDSTIDDLEPVTTEE